MLYRKIRTMGIYIGIWSIIVIDLMYQYRIRSDIDTKSIDTVTLKSTSLLSWLCWQFCSDCVVVWHVLNTSYVRSKHGVFSFKTIQNYESPVSKDYVISGSKIKNEYNFKILKLYYVWIVSFGKSISIMQRKFLCDWKFTKGSYSTLFSVGGVKCKCLWCYHRLRHLRCWFTMFFKKPRLFG